MSDEKDGLSEGAEEAPETGTTQEPDENTKLRSRNAGLDAKVSSLTATAAAEKARADAAEARAQALADGKENGDAELRAQNAALKAEAEEARQAARVALLAGRYPESFAELGEAIGNISPDKLASMEARLAGVPSPEDQSNNVRPIGNNQNRSASTTAARTPSEQLADMEAKFLSTAPPWDID